MRGSEREFQFRNSLGGKAALVSVDINNKGILKYRRVILSVCRPSIHSNKCDFDFVQKGFWFIWLATETHFSDGTGGLAKSNKN